MQSLDSPFGAPTTPENRTVRGGFTVDSESVGPEAASSSAVDLGVHVPPTDLEPTFHAVSADSKPAPKPAPANKKAKSKTTAKIGAKGHTEQTTLTQMDLEARVDVQSIDKAQQQAIAAQNRGCQQCGIWRTRSSRAETQTQSIGRDHVQCSCT